ncbi:unnamed protein product, partial [Nesidiocoris tenuis]
MSWTTIADEAMSISLSQSYQAMTCPDAWFQRLFLRAAVHARDTFGNRKHITSRSVDNKKGEEDRIFYTGRRTSRLVFMLTSQRHLTVP